LDEATGRFSTNTIILKGDAEDIIKDRISRK
jgi:hypothetical protein